MAKIDKTTREPLQISLRTAAGGISAADERDPESLPDHCEGVATLLASVLSG
jgi:hypothetical protein